VAHGLAGQSDERRSARGGAGVDEAGGAAKRLAEVGMKSRDLLGAGLGRSHDGQQAGAEGSGEGQVV